MPRSSVKGELRRRELAALLLASDRISSADAAVRLGVSEMTIRRDLQILEESGVAVRAYGGAVAAQRISFEFAFDQRRQRNTDEKRRIGVAAAGLIGPGETAFLDTGTTTLEVARALAERPEPCGVITCSLVVASVLWGREHVELTLLGGRVRHRSPDLGGAGTEMMLERLAADVAVLGADGVHPERGCFAQDIEFARIPELMALHAGRSVVVADSEKLGRTSGARYLTVGDLGTLVTDSGAPQRLVEALRARGVAVHIV
jgi:DeoR family transcriptional regulator, aga operon transcriptional repressor